ncbi:FixH family protein [Marinobacter sp. M216]|uniref:FixH family protein n=1 Tax=Marinobacter albus TaxID=3030833 RepID=A0ABT7HB23_9GAMM|nr:MULTISPECIES: FixH family protein [unclassified Marinobacter]MBW7470192.1 FixH family protein [Marinobacter sp. F4218]MDK9557544.1 FixH family protein [Marinobacter sp. M216]
MTEQAPIAPWYRQPWFWFLTIFPLAAIIWCIFMIIIATNLEDTMVTDDYSKEGRGINMEIARDKKAKDLGMVAEMRFNDRTIALTLSTDQGPTDFPYLILNLFHPTLADRDRTIQFQKTDTGEYRGQMLEDIDGRWYYDLRGPENRWRLKGEAWLPAENGITVSSEGAAKG